MREAARLARFASHVGQEKLITRHRSNQWITNGFKGGYNRSPAGAEVFTVTRLLPPLGAELQYRIKSEGEAHERVAPERELQVELEKPIVVAGSRLPPVNVDATPIFAGFIPLATEPPSGTARWERRDNALATLRQGMAAGEFRAGDAELSAICFVCACIRSRDLRLMVESVQDPEPATGQIINFCLAALA